ncbi:olfactory receptor 6N1-like [Erpetoichthys calabaricus]|uniref:olfactory receptor 6N1-like n=1 Tax=Erpetoichthys calabaricus TaxID=27687 RepID=UPI0022344188|nr:olfactory receptor 6N1-like [Erpetoichthys calabaricus]
MSGTNQTMLVIKEFILVGFPGFQDQESRKTLFTIFLITYLFILLVNLMLISIFIVDRNLHTPMYFLVCSLAVLDIVLSTTTVPRMLVLFIADLRSTPFAACFTQVYLFLSLTSVECFLLGLMAYDRFFAVSKPLHYPTIMTNRHILKLIICCWLGGFLCPATAVGLALRFPFCGPNKITQCFCDYSSVLLLACGDIMVTSYVALAIGLCILFIPLIYIIFSYAKIIMSVLKISSAGRMKAFSTCGTHLLVISLYFFVIAGVYISYRIPGTSVDVRIMASVLQNVLPPLMNPIIYCLRTKEIRESFARNLWKIRNILTHSITLQ